MRRTPLYSSSSRPRPAGPPAAAGAAQAKSPGAVSDSRARAWWRGFCGRHQHLLTIFASASVALLAVAGYHAVYPAPRALNQHDIDSAVLHTLENNVLPSVDAAAYEAVRGAIVRVQAYSPPAKAGPRRAKARRNAPDAEADAPQGIGTGVVIVDKGIILTNLHVVHGFQRITVTFADGLESDAYVVGTAPEHDLAVLQAATVPDDLAAATMRSTHDLVPGDRVIAVGFPFGIGPSVSSGVVSGLRREYRSPRGKRLLTNLIQFDAAANPGNSGGPLVTADGEVVGIVTGILNPGGQGVFIGIGFAVPIENAALAAGIPPF